MANVKIDLSKTQGQIKPMHAVNNGPSYTLGTHTGGWDKTADLAKIRNGNIEEFKAAGIPFARTHDSSFYSKYGLEHTIDVHAIFPNFDADPTDPASYDFACTDHYLDMIEGSGTKIFYRLGSRIEHEFKKYGTLVPKDYHKWAVICEHIIRHCNEGWADGAHRNIAYWEIWNEPDLDADTADNKRTWGGTQQDFFEFYHVAATHLKQCFPHLKIGGPALAVHYSFAEKFLAQLKAPLDFFSWHIYAHDIEAIAARAARMRELLDQNGFTETESILNEWNYVQGWSGDDLIYSYIQQKNVKGAAFNLAAMCTCQHGPVDMLMYYDARPCNWNGLFDFMQLGKVTTKAYYSFPAFNTLYTLGNSVCCSSDDANVYVCAAKNGSEAAFVLTHYNNDDNHAGTQVTIDISGASFANGTELEVYLLDGERDLTLADSVIFHGDKITLKRPLPNFTTYLIKLRERA